MEGWETSIMEGWEQWEAPIMEGWEQWEALTCTIGGTHSEHLFIALLVIYMTKNGSQQVIKNNMIVNMIFVALSSRLSFLRLEVIVLSIEMFC